jgi:hypothetical protein
MLKKGDRVYSVFDGVTVPGTVEKYRPKHYLPVTVRWDDGSYGACVLRELIAQVPALVSTSAPSTKEKT